MESVEEITGGGFTIVVSSAIESLQSCMSLILAGASNIDLAVSRIESVILTLNAGRSIVALNDPLSNIIRTLEESVLSLLCALDIGPNHGRGRGRPRLPLTSNLEYLLSMNFKTPQIAKMLGVSVRTVFNRFCEEGLSVRRTYTTITDEVLDSKILSSLMTHPNTGYKRMKGFLAVQGIKITDQRIRERMRVVDPDGVYQRTRENRAIVRRQYFVEYSNDMWHIDTNMKLIRWKIVIRGAVDGKSRTSIYLEAGSDNTAESGVLSFLKGVAAYGIPSRTRSDKGGENVLIARYMLENRGLGRASHICGRSVHNQRIERFWRDVSYGCVGFYYSIFYALEEDGVLNVDIPEHLFVLHKVFLPRLNRHLNMFREAWNLHPISTEHNMTPTQLMLMFMPPPTAQLDLTVHELNDLYFVCNELTDTLLLTEGIEDTITTPIPPINVNLPQDILSRINSIDYLRDSNSFGYDIYLEVVENLQL